VLQSKKLRLTENREQILSYFLQENRALTHGDLERQFVEMDRVTIYRTLHRFHEKGIVHRIPGDQGIAQYALCDSGLCDHHHKENNHLHFTCDRCQQTSCLNHLTPPEIQLPPGYTLSSVHLVVKGLCKDCASTTYSA
jgi:Fur family ferric uptake transcriptional regulator